ncbi:DsbA family protein [Enhygromyxa salina]|uniref:DSBA-like thioredoxin domain protein n=1 Tax=Enhygromyxa salina TaxID=215803 RepID=A0A2S9YXG0_9BACT|nr:thioredoxin domain-containing protein [Enhygromyxa salina]PRQ09770.1 DSBA-like thioredoxin domain protein [Enhygromyxa salina]
MKLHVLTKQVVLGFAVCSLLAACVEPPQPSQDDAEAVDAGKAATAADPLAVITGERLPAEYDDTAITHGAPKGAKVTIVEYADFECAYCKKLSDTVDHIAAQHPDDVRVVFKQFPLPGHSRAMPAGAAALAAEAQGKGEAYRARLFKYRSLLSETDLDAHAEAVGMPDMAKFRAQRSSPELLGQLERERDEGGRVGVTSPPYAFINGRPIPTVLSLEEFTTLVDEELALADRVLAAGATQADLYDHYMRYARASWVDPATVAPPAAPDEAPQTRNVEAGQYYAVLVDDSAASGPEDALVTVVAFMDLSSITSKDLAATLAAVRERAPDVRVVFRHVVPKQAERQVLARAGLVALAADQFWPWFEALAKADAGEPEASALAAAQAIGIDADELRARMIEGPITAKLARDHAAASALALERMPGYFINGRFVGIDASVDALISAIDQERALAQSFRSEHANAEDPYYEQLSAYPYSVADVSPPPADHFRREVALEGLPVRGDRKTANVHILECADFDCDACEVGNQSLGQIELEFGDRVAIYFRNYPLSIHPTAEPAARAVVAAGNQGKFWEMHDFLFANDQRRQLAEFSVAAGELGLDVSRFEKDFAADKTAKQVVADYDACRALGVRGAPGFLINGRLVSGALPVEGFRQVVNEELNGGFEAAQPSRR